MDFSNIFCWLIPLLVGLICAILGYLLGRLFGNSNTNDNDYSADLDACNRKNSQLQSDLDSCRANLNVKVKPIAVANSTASMASGFAAAAVSSGVAFDAGSAKAAFGKKINEDDLTAVEGIGPKIRELFHNFGINTWAKLGDASIEKCQEVLSSGGKRYEIHNPNSWPTQAKMAAQGKWAELKKWQDENDSTKA